MSEAQFPLKTLRIESGSWWVALSGNTAVTSFVVLAIGAVANYVYRNYIHEGRLSQIPEQTKAIQAVLGIEEELRKRGLPVDDMQAAIVKASVKVADNLVTLLGNETSVEVDGVLHPMTPFEQRALPDRIESLALRDKEEPKAGEQALQ